jgi:hypothetical protein
LAACYGQMGRFEEAKTEGNRFMQLHPWDLERRDPPDPEYPHLPRALTGFVKSYKDPEDFLHWIDGWRKADMPA